jgi:hypothetical protein
MKGFDMGSYPTSPRAAFLTWCQAHVEVFLENAVDIGLTTDQAQAFQLATSSAAATDAAQASAREALRAATVDNTQTFAALRRSAAEMVRSIRTFAENTNDPKVYVLAQVPPPQSPSVAPPPAQPTDLSVAIEPGTGALELRWKASNPVGTQGTAYIVRRRTSPTAEFVFVGVTGEKRFVDNSFFAGPDSVQYTIQGQRADQSGPTSNILTINFGRTGGGLTIASADETTDQAQGTRLAA